jgi:hypothetical protein
MGLLTANLSIAFIFCSATLCCFQLVVQRPTKVTEGVIFWQQRSVEKRDREISRFESGLSTLTLGVNYMRVHNPSSLQ